MFDIKQIKNTSATVGAVPIKTTNGLVWSNSTDTFGAAAGVIVAGGTQSSPSITFSDSVNTGLHLISPSKIGITTGGSTRLFVNTVSMTGYVPIRLQKSSTPAFTFEGDTDTGISSNADNTLNIQTNGNVRLTVTDEHVTVTGTGALIVPTGASSSRPIGVLGAIRYNSESNQYEAYYSDGWHPFVISISQDTFTRTAVTTAEYTATNSDYYIGVNYAGNCTITLPEGVENKRFIIKDESGNAAINNISINAYTNQNIDGNSTVSIALNYGAVSMVFGGGAWRIY